jgi:hypothetical protein
VKIGTRNKSKEFLEMKNKSKRCCEERRELEIFDFIVNKNTNKKLYFEKQFSFKTSTFKF